MDAARDGSNVVHDGVEAIAYRIPITIQSGKVSGTQTDFPVWIDLSNTPINQHARSDGTDIFFTDGSGSALDYEIQHWDATASLLEAWVRLPSLPSTTNTLIYVEYGDLALATAPNPTGVFESSFIGVWHLDDTLETSAVADSTGKSNGTASGLGSSQQVTAKLGGGIAFTGDAAQQIAFTNTLTGNGASTFSAWVNQNSDSNTSAVITIGTGGSDEARFLYGGYANTGNGIGVGQFDDDWPTGINIANGGWELLHWVVEGGTTKTWHLYQNGVEVGGTGHTANAAPNTTGTTGLLGNAPAGTFGGPPNTMNGIIDEARIATTARDATWVATEFANQNSPSTFYTVGQPENVQ